MFLKNKFFPNMTIELIQDDKNNCYIYDEKDVILASDRFGKWFEKLKSIRDKIPHNKLVKFILSSLHGRLSQKCTMKCNIEDDDKKKNILDRGYSFLRSEGKKEKIVLVYHKSSYLNIRLQPFLTSKARCRMVNQMVIPYFNQIDSIKRIVCDGIIYDQNLHTKNTQFLAKDEKHSGKIKLVGRSVTKLN